MRHSQASLAGLLIQQGLQWESATRKTTKKKFVRDGVRFLSRGKSQRDELEKRELDRI